MSAHPTSAPPHVEIARQRSAAARASVDVRRILLSLVHNSVIVGEPYQGRVVTLPGQEGKRILLRFRLLADVEVQVRPETFRYTDDDGNERKLRRPPAAP